MTRTGILLIAALITVWTFHSCTTTPDLEREKTEILEVYRGSIKAMMEKDIDYLLDTYADEYSYAVDGMMTTEDKEDTRGYLETLFKRENFIAVENLVEPIVEVSKGGDMAWILTNTKAVMQHLDEQGNIFGEEVNISGAISIYKKINGRWKEVAGSFSNKQMPDHP